ncbi:MAG: hypothetical protein K2O16_13270 [Lachnospiraceae bacterium]|nr:hypothetical protein [Lachnospiraceae bacterium]
MFLYEKKIVYLSMYVDGIKDASAGFVRISRERDSYLLDIHIKQMAGYADVSHPLLLIFRREKVQLAALTATGGEINAKRSVLVNRENICLGGEEYREKDLCGIMLFLDNRHEIRGCWQEPERVQEPIKEDKVLTAAVREERNIHKSQDARGEQGACKRRDVCEVQSISGKQGRHEEQKRMENFNQKEQRWSEPNREMRGPREVLIEPASEDKWEQLQKCYKKVHPFGDERLFLTIEPKDFIILQAPFQRLVNNSFLLHGFYNYRHLILGPDKEIGNGTETCFYLGVPGTYFEREKMVAVMFGFEGFECSGPVEIGKFGYYMRRVEL